MQTDSHYCICALTYPFPYYIVIKVFTCSSLSTELHIIDFFFICYFTFIICVNIYVFIIIKQLIKHSLFLLINFNILLLLLIILRIVSILMLSLKINLILSQFKFTFCLYCRLLLLSATSLIKLNIVQFYLPNFIVREGISLIFLIFC